MVWCADGGPGAFSVRPTKVLTLRLDLADGARFAGLAMNDEAADGMHYDIQDLTTVSEHEYRDRHLSTHHSMALSLGGSVLRINICQIFDIPDAQLGREWRGPWET